jgi:hypothetical protein
LESIFEKKDIEKLEKVQRRATNIESLKGNNLSRKKKNVRLANSEGKKHQVLTLI